MDARFSAFAAGAKADLIDLQRTGLFDESSHDEHCGRCHASDRRQRRKVWRVAEVLDQEFGEDPYLACGMLA